MGVLWGVDRSRVGLRQGPLGVLEVVDGVVDGAANGYPRVRIGVDGFLRITGRVGFRLS